MDDLSDREAMLSRAKEATDAMPEGHRVLISWDLHRDMAWHPDDVLRDADGNVAGCREEESGAFIPYRSVWWDHGVARAATRLDNWFREYKEKGGRVDVVVVDFEQGLSYWHLLGLAQREYPCGLEAYLDAIEADPRFPELVARAPLLPWLAIRIPSRYSRMKDPS